MSEAGEKRLQLLKHMTESENADAFAWYGLAMEHRRRGETKEALSAFDSLRAAFPEYLAQYLMAGQMLIEGERFDEATTWLEQGVALAKKCGDAQALGELEAALDECE